MNSGLAGLLIRVAGTTMGLMAVIMLCCIATPHIAKWIDKRLPRPTKGVGDEPSPENGQQEVQGPFDPQSLPEYDLNYKIYHKDIYGVDFKHGKEKQDGRSDNLDG